MPRLGLTDLYSAEETAHPGYLVQQRRAHRTANRGFTLVELLVVIGIIALLISILLPSLTKARATANTVVCQSNLSQIYIGTQLYRNLYKDFYPETVQWFPFESLYPPNGRTWDFPATWFNGIPQSMGLPPMGAAANYYYNWTPYPARYFRCPTQAQISDQPSTYGANDWLQQWALSNANIPGMLSSDIGIKASWLYKIRFFDQKGNSHGWNDVPYFADGFYLQDGFGVWRYDSNRSWGNIAFFFGGTAHVAENLRAPSNPHNKGMNVLFLDGHIATVKPSDPLYTQAPWYYQGKTKTSNVYIW